MTPICRCLWIVAAFLTSCSSAPPAEIEPAPAPDAPLAAAVIVAREGTVFSSRWRVEVRARTVAQRTAAEADGPAAIEGALGEVDRWFSAWRADSDIATLNSRPAGQPGAFHIEAVRVIDSCIAVSRLTDGAFDITVGPLLELWGFSPRTQGEVVRTPSEHELASARRRVGTDLVGVESGFVVRRAAGVIVDVTSVTDAAAAAHVMRALRALQLPEALVDVAGEVVVSGGSWVVGVEAPGGAPSAGPPVVVARVRLTPAAGQELALSTSGTTRDVRTLDDGTRTSHIIDPRTGRPAPLTLASCTVVGPDVVVADALSTACVVLGETATRAALARVGYEGLFISLAGDLAHTAGFPFVDDVNQVPPLPRAPSPTGATRP